MEMTLSDSILHTLLGNLLDAYHYINIDAVTQDCQAVPQKLKFNLSYALSGRWYVSQSHLQREILGTKC